MSKSEERDTRGRFLPGCAGGPGNPRVRQLAAWREALTAAVKPSDVKKIITMLVREAKKGSIPAAVEVLNRIFGKPAQADIIEQLDDLERQIEGLRNERS